MLENPPDLATALPLDVALKTYVPEGLWADYETAKSNLANLGERPSYFDRSFSSHEHAARFKSFKDAKHGLIQAKKAAWQKIINSFTTLVVRGKVLIFVAEDAVYGPYVLLPSHAWAAAAPKDERSPIKTTDGKIWAAYVVETPAIRSVGEISPTSSTPVITEPQQSCTAWQRPVEIAFDTNRKPPQLVISGVCVFSRANYNLLKTLYDLTPEEQHGAIPADKRPFTSSRELADELRLDEATVRARVAQIRKKLAAACPERFGSPEQQHLLIESHPRSGYRFHWAVRFIPLDQAIRVNPQRKSSKTATQENDGR